MAGSGGVAGAGVIGSFLRPPVVGRPYYAEQVNEHVEVRPDGTRVTISRTSSLVFRDSRGRTRSALRSPLPDGEGLNAVATLVLIEDPVAGVLIRLDPDDKTAIRTAGWDRAQAPATPGTISGNTGTPDVRGVPEAAGRTLRVPRTTPEIRHERLGTQEFDGIVAEGNRITMTYPQGLGTIQHPATTVTENWDSRDLQIVLLAKASTHIGARGRRDW